MHGAGEFRLCLSPFDFYVNPLFVALERLWWFTLLCDVLLGTREKLWCFRQFN